MFKLTLNNFRGFKSETFDFSRLNILIGENSSGKSSVLKFLLALKQSFERTNAQEFNLTLSDDDVDLGNYSEMISDHDTNKHLGFTFTFNDYYQFFYDKFLSYYLFDKPDSDTENSKPEFIERRQRIISYLPVTSNSEATIKVELTSELDKHKTIKLSLESPEIGIIQILFPEKEDSVDRFMGESPKCILIFTDINGDILEIPNVGYEKKAFLSIVGANSLREQLRSKIGNEEIENKTFMRLAYILVIQNYLEYTVERVEFVNPIDSKPERFYFDKDKKSVYKTNDIDKLVNMISKKNFSPDFLERFYGIISDYGLAKDLNITSDNKLPVKELRVKINNLWNNITDVGYGVSLQLPIIFEALLAEISTEQKILLIEQPEVHLHPKLQAKFIETLLKLGTKNSYFIETHSEYIIRKLQILVKEKSHHLKSSDVSINYLSNQDSQSFKSIHHISDNGRLIPRLPSTFFDNSYELAKGLLD